MKELKLKYGCNPNQKVAYLSIDKGSLPIEVLNGSPGYINFLDALNAYQLVKEADIALNLASAASFKHVSPAGVGVGLPLNDRLKRAYFIDNIELSSQALAYARARGADRMSSFGDFIALSRECDLATALLIKKEVSDGIIAPSYEKEALSILKNKKGGKYCIIKIDKDYTPPLLETKQVYGISFTQEHNFIKIDDSALNNIVTKNKTLSRQDKNNLILSLITLKYTQSNSVCFCQDGQTIGVGAGQQSRIHCTRLAGEKADIWQLRQHDKVLNLPFKNGIKRPDRDNAIDNYIRTYDSKERIKNTNWQDFFTAPPTPFTEDEKKTYLKTIQNVSLGSDAFFPFGDNIDEAVRHGVKTIAAPGGSVRDDNVIDACNKYNIVLSFIPFRLFHH